MGALAPGDGCTRTIIVGNQITRVITGVDFWLPGNDPWGGKVKRVSESRVDAGLVVGNFSKCTYVGTYVRLRRLDVGSA